MLYRPVTEETNGAETTTLYRYDLLSHAESRTGLTDPAEYLAAVHTGWLGRSDDSMVLHEGNRTTPILTDLGGL